MRLTFWKFKLRGVFFLLLLFSEIRGHFVLIFGGTFKRIKQKETKFVFEEIINSLFANIKYQNNKNILIQNIYSKTITFEARVFFKLPSLGTTNLVGSHSSKSTFSS